MTACIVGWGHLPFGKHEGRDVESLIVEAATLALGDAGVAPADVDEIVLGHFNGGFVRQDFTARSCSRPTRRSASSPRPGSRTPAPPAPPPSTPACAPSRPATPASSWSSASRR